MLPTAWRARRLPMVLAGLTALVLIAALTVILVVNRAEAQLRVEVTGLPAGLAGAVTVTGPTDYSFAGAVDQRGVRPGEYTMRIEPVRTELGMAYPEVDEIPIGPLVADATVTVVAEYAVVIPETTKVLDYRDPGITSVDSLTVTFDPGSPSVARLRLGDVFVVAEGPQTPDFLVRRIETITSSPAGIAMTTTSVSLSEALPSGRYRVDETSLGLHAVKPAAYTGVAEARAEEPMFSVNFGDMLLKDGKCGYQGGKAVLDVHNLRPQLGGSFDWGLFPPHVDVRIDATLNPRVTFRADFGGAATCAKKWSGEDGLRWLNMLCDKVVGTLVRVGPVSLRCKVQPYFEVELQQTSPASVDFDATVTGGIKQNTPTLAVTDFSKRSLAQQIFEGDTVQWSVAMEAGLEIGLYGGDPTGTAWLGVTFDVGFGPELVLQPTAPQAELFLNAHARLKSTVRLDARFKDFTAEFKLGEIEKRSSLWANEDTSFRTLRPVPTKLPSGLRLPAESADEEQGAVATTDRSATWATTLVCDAGGVVPGRKLPSDADRTDMRNVDFGFGDSSAKWQLAVYKDVASASAAYQEITKNVNTCPYESWTEPKAAGLGHESWSRGLFRSNNLPSGMGGVYTVTVARQGNAVIVARTGYGPALARDRQSSSPAQNAEIKKVFSTLCAAGFPC